MPARPGVLAGASLAYGYVAFLFLPIGTRATIVSMLVPRIAPRASSAPSSAGSLSAIASALPPAPCLSGALYDLTGSYLVIYTVAATMVVIALIALVIFVRGTTADL